ncbi:LacI family DNA-binding transcriptional regulator [Streptomyces sp. NPDC002920]
MPVTMRDVAKAAGVSSATVSFVVNNTKPVLPETRDRVERAMTELGFQRNAVARALASKRTQIIALVAPFSEERSSLAVREFILGAARAASLAGHNLVIWPVDNDDITGLIELVGQQLVDGVLLMAVQLDDPRVSALAENGTSFALIGRTRDVGGLPYVDVDYDATMALALGHLTELGHRRIVLVNGSQTPAGFAGFGPYVRSERAYLEQSAKLGMEPMIVTSEQSVRSGRRAAGEVLELAPEATAVIVADEMAAPGLVAELAARGRRIPADMSVVSILAAAEVAALCNPPLTVVTVAGRQLGHAGVEALLGHLDGSPVTDGILKVGELIIGESTGRPRSL